MPRFAEIRYERSVPTLEEFWKIYAAAEFDKDRLMLFAYLQTSARRDELFRLKWIDVDFTKKRLRLRWRKNSIGEWRESWLPVGDELLDMLKVQRKATGKLDFVFMRCTDDGPWVPYEASREALEALPKLEDQSVWKVFEKDVRKNEKPTDNPHWRVGVCLRASEQSLSN